MDNGHLQIRGIKKIDEGMYTCEARVMARGEIDFRIIKVVVNGKHCIPFTSCSLPALSLIKELLLNIVRCINDDPESFLWQQRKPKYLFVHTKHQNVMGRLNSFHVELEGFV